MADIQWSNLRSPDLARLAQQDAIVILPVASTEQHGPHLPVQVDALLVNEVALRAARIVQASTPIVVAPTVWFGLAEHHMAFGGTLSVEFDTFRAVIRNLVHSMQRHGFRRILLLNGHGGNMTALDVIVTELALDRDLKIASATYFDLPETVEASRAVLEDQTGLLHAGEAETSMVLALRPELVDEEAMRSLEGSVTSWLQTSGIYRPVSFRDRTETGVNGHTRNATAEKGERLLEIAANSLARALLESGLFAD
ncbi:creatininase family protein [Roseovarius sp. 2305UL8-3]|uniref:creatininase family protein n=1 Tax=Roseovarius conchicola TaxID=3121636 RepID=UPI003529B700